MRKICVTIFLVFLAVSSYAQNGTRAVDYSTRSIGRGGTEIGFFDGPSVMITNPAGMSFIKKPVLNANAIFMVPPTHFKNYKKDASGKVTTTLLNDNDGEKILYVMPSLAYVHNIKDSKFTFGAGVFTTGGMGTEAKYLHQLFATPQNYRSRFGVIESVISGSYLITPNLSFGITGEFVYSTIELSQPFSLPPSVLQGKVVTSQGTTTFGNYFSNPRPAGLGYRELTAAAEMTNLKSYTFGGKIGFAYKFNEVFTFGASYTASVPLNFKNGNAQMDMSAQFNEAAGRAVMNLMQIYPGISQDSATHMVMAFFGANGINPAAGFVANYTVTNEFKTPQSFGFGLKYAPLSKLRFGFDFEWLNWSKAFDKMKITLSSGSNSNINKLINNGGTGQSDLVVEFPMNWKDAVILKFGGEYDLCKKMTVRAGYSYSTNPIPSETIIPIMPAILEHHIMAGFSYDILEKLTMNLALEYGVKNTVTGSANHKVASEYINSESSLQNLLGHISLNYNF